MFEEPLQLCPVEKWSVLEDIFKADWPRGISGLITLEMQKYMLQCGFDHGLKVYCPYGNGKHGMIAINEKKGLYEVIVQCPMDDTSILEDVLNTTGIIDWEKQIEVPFVPKHVINCIRRVIENKNVIIQQIISATPYFLDNTTPLFNVKLPPGFSFDLLSLEHVKLLDSTWHHRYDGCNLYFELIIKAKLGYGLFRENQLVSWSLIRETGSLLHLFTPQAERRKGYGELVLKLISNVLIKNGKYVVAFCKKDNINAAKLYEKLNFQQMSDIEWCTLEKNA